MITLEKIDSSTQWLRSTFAAPAIGVDRDNKVLRGYVVAQEGAFKSEGRGEFDRQSLQQIVSLMKAEPAGLKSRFSHPTLSDDGVGKFLGRARNPRMEGEKVRADLFLDKTSFDTPSGNLGKYVLDLAESDPDALSSSLVLKTDMLSRLDKEGNLILDDDGEPLPPIWRPVELHASDIVDTGDAVDGLLSVDGLPDAQVRHGMQLLDSAFAGKSEVYIRQHCTTWLNRYLQQRFPKNDQEIKLKQKIDKIRRFSYNA